jgi:hypothetical protein
MEMAREVTAEHPDLASGFPNVEFVRAISSKLKLSLADKEEESIVSAPKPKW